MYSQLNSLKAFVSNLNKYTLIGNVADLQEGELGFFEANTGDVIADGIGTGYFAMMKDSIVLKSKVLTFAGWAAALQSYSAPTLKESTITIGTATVGETYQINVEVKWEGFGGEFYLHGNYVAVTGDGVTEIAAGLTTSINNQLTREGLTGLLTVTSALGVITFSNVLTDYVQGKHYGKPVKFRARLTLPTTLAVVETITQVPSDGIGYGPYIAEKEYFAQGDHDHHRLISWRNNFDWQGNALATGQYDVAVANDPNVNNTANADVRSPQDILIAFNTVGQTIVPTIDAAADADTEVTGVAFPGSSVILYVDGTPQSPVTADGTTGVFTVAHDPATGEVLTATAQAAGTSVSNVSAAVTVTA